jgi:hypothetical protein
MQLACELPVLEPLQVNLLIETVAPGYLRRAAQKEPRRDSALAHAKDGLSGSKMPLVRFGEPSHDIELRSLKPWKALRVSI